MSIPSRLPKEIPVNPFIHIDATLQPNSVSSGGQEDAPFCRNSIYNNAILTGGPSNSPSWDGEQWYFDSSVGGMGWSRGSVIQKNPNSVTAFLVIKRPDTSATSFGYAVNEICDNIKQGWRIRWDADSGTPGRFQIVYIDSGNNLSNNFVFENEYGSDPLNYGVAGMRLRLDDAMEPFYNHAPVSSEALDLSGLSWSNQLQHVGVGNLGIYNSIEAEMDLKEVIIFHDYLKDGEIVNLINHLQSKHGIS